MNVKRIFMNV